MEPQRIPDRIIVYPRDVKNITGRNIRTCQRMINRVKAAYAKGEYDLVTIGEFCAFFELEEEEIRKFLKA